MAPTLCWQLWGSQAKDLLPTPPPRPAGRSRWGCYLSAATGLEKLYARHDDLGCDPRAQLLWCFPWVSGDRVTCRQQDGLWTAWGLVPLCAETPSQPKLGGDASHRFCHDPPCVSNLSQVPSELGDDARFRESPARSASLHTGKFGQNPWQGSAPFSK